MYSFFVSSVRTCERCTFSFLSVGSSIERHQNKNKNKFHDWKFCFAHWRQDPQKSYRSFLGDGLFANSVEQIIKIFNKQRTFFGVVVGPIFFDRRRNFGNDGKFCFAHWWQDPQKSYCLFVGDGLFANSFDQIIRFFNKQRTFFRVVVRTIFLAIVEINRPPRTVP